MFYKIILVYLFLFICNILYSHPHLFIKPSIKIINDNNNNIKGLQITWEWDKWWSQDVTLACDKNKDGKFDQKEIGNVYKDFFIGIKDFNFFTILYVDSKKIIIKNVLNFGVELKNGIVSYNFLIPLDIPVINKINFKIIFNDETIYTAFDEIINILDNNNYTNVKIIEYSYYGRQIIFDYINN